MFFIECKLNQDIRPLFHRLLDGFYADYEQMNRKYIHLTSKYLQRKRTHENYRQEKERLKIGMYNYILSEGMLNENIDILQEEIVKVCDELKAVKEVESVGKERIDEQIETLREERKWDEKRNNALRKEIEELKDVLNGYLVERLEKGDGHEGVEEPEYRSALRINEVGKESKIPRLLTRFPFESEASACSRLNISRSMPVPDTKSFDRKFEAKDQKSKSNMALEHIGSSEQPRQLHSRQHNLEENADDNTMQTTTLFAISRSAPPTLLAEVTSENKTSFSSITTLPPILLNVEKNFRLARSNERSLIPVPPSPPLSERSSADDHDYSMSMSPNANVIPIVTQKRNVLQKHYKAILSAPSNKSATNTKLLRKRSNMSSAKASHNSNF